MVDSGPMVTCPDHDGIGMHVRLGVDGGRDTLVFVDRHGGDATGTAGRGLRGGVGQTWPTTQVMP